MKPAFSIPPGSSERGMALATLLVVMLMVAMAILVSTNSSALERLRQRLTFLEQQQCRKLSADPAIKTTSQPARQPEKKR